jgi:hypothetical protein
MTKQSRHHVSRVFRGLPRVRDLRSPSIHSANHRHPSRPVIPSGASRRFFFSFAPVYPEPAPAGEGRTNRLVQPRNLSSIDREASNVSSTAPSPCPRQPNTAAHHSYAVTTAINRSISRSVLKTCGDTRKFPSRKLTNTFSACNFLYNSADFSGVRPEKHA